MATEPLRRHTSHESCTGDRVSENLPIASYPDPSFQYPYTSRPSFFPFDECSPPTGVARRGLVLVGRTVTSHFQCTPSFCDQHLFGPPTTQEGEKARRWGAVRVLNEVYVRIAFPSTEERQELALKLNMTPRSVHIWYISFFTSSTAHLVSP